MLDTLKSTVEYQGFGSNILTAGAIGAMIVLIWESYGIIAQIRKIWHERAAEALSSYMFGYTAAFMAASIPYGIATKSATIVISAGVVFLLHLPIMWGIMTFRGYTLKESVITCTFFLMVIAMIAMPSWMDAFYLAFSIGTLYAFGTQAWQIWREKSAGTLEIKLILVYMASSVFWGCYAFAAGLVPLMILNPLFFMLMLLIVLLWRRYKNNGATVAVAAQ
jgi:uncharacterized protein with PQ loop repeat